MVAPLIAMAKMGLKGLKVVVFVVMLILSIVLLAGASQANKKVKGSAKAKALISFATFLFVMTLLYPFLAAKFPPMAVMGTYFVFAIIAMSLAIPLAKEIKDTKGKKDATNAKNAAVGLFTMLMIFVVLMIAAKVAGDKFPMARRVAKMLL